MKQRKFRKSTLTGFSVAIAATVMSSFPVAAASPQSPWENMEQGEIIESTSIRSSVSVSFQNLPIGLPFPPQIVNSTMMVPGKALLEGLGYETLWDAAEKKLVATHKDRPSLTFWVNRHEAEIDGKKVTDLKAAPFISEQTMWIPLRLAAEASGLTVTWDALNRFAFVKDPHALPYFSITTRVNNGVSDHPLELTEYMKKSMKTNVQFNLIPPDYYREKVNILIASGNMSSIMLLDEPYQHQDELLESIAIDLTKELEAFPRLKKLAEGPGGRTIDGKTYGISRPSDPHDAIFPAIRQDWLDVLDLAQPKTMDEIYEVLKRFTTQDPDGNGKNDTYGLSGYVNGAGLGSLAWVEHAYTGSPDRFSVKDGKVIDHAISLEQELALKWLARAYSEGVIEKEFALKTKVQANSQLSENRAGLAAISVADSIALSTDKLTWIPLQSIKATAASAAIAPWNTKGNGMYIISSMSKEEPKQLLKWLDKGFEMTENGEWNDSKELEDADYSAIINLFGENDLLKNNSLQSLPDAKGSAYKAVVSEWRKTSYEGKTLPAANGLFNTGKYSELNDKLVQFKIKVILGAASLADWQKFTSTLVASDEYKAMMTELNALASK